MQLTLNACGNSVEWSSVQSDVWQDYTVSLSYKVAQETTHGTESSGMLLTTRFDHLDPLLAHTYKRDRKTPGKER